MPGPTVPNPKQSDHALAATVESSHADSAIPSRGAFALDRGAMIGQYEIEGELGRGGMGEVFAAVHPLIGKRVAIKVIRRDKAGTTGAVERFLQEARAVNLIRHPNIVDIFAFGSLPDGRPYLAMELLVGETLRERLQRGSVPLPELCHIGEGIVRALQAAHAEGIVHRDLKPENVFLVDVDGEPQRIKLLDFGLAKLVDRVDLRADVTASGVLLGTPRYLAPEQACGDEVGSYTDLYALGAMLFEMGTGQPPFAGREAIELLAHHLSSPPPRPTSIAPELPDSLDALIVALLAKSPDDRPDLQTVRQVLGECRSAPSAPRRRRFRLATAAFLTAAVLSAAVVTWLADEERGPGDTGDATSINPGDPHVPPSNNAAVVPEPVMTPAIPVPVLEDATTASPTLSPASIPASPPRRTPTRTRSFERNARCAKGDRGCDVSQGAAVTSPTTGTGDAKESVGNSDPTSAGATDPAPVLSPAQKPESNDDELLDVYETGELPR